MSRIVVDVREPEEYAKGHVEGALNIPPAEIMNGAEKLADAPKDTEIILYCISGSRSNVCKGILEQMGYSSVVNGINMHQVEAKYLR